MSGKVSEGELGNHFNEIFSRYISGRIANNIEPVHITLPVFDQNSIYGELRGAGLNFEGRKLPISSIPTIVDRGSLAQAAYHGETIHQLLERIIDVTLHEIRSKPKNSKWLDFYGSYRKYFDLIALERRQSPQISLMRYDALEPSPGKWMFLETNTHCPGGVIHCALIREAWLNSVAGKYISEQLDIHSSLMDSADAFVHYLVRQAQLISQKHAPNILLATYRGFYPNELQTIVLRHGQLYDSKSQLAGSCLVGDIREIETDRFGRVSFRGINLDLIYNKLDPLMITHNCAETRGWQAAAASEHVEFLNGLGASYLTETKRTLAALWDRDLLQSLTPNQQAEQAVRSVIPYSEVLSQDSSLSDRVILGRNNYILKPDALTRGSGVVIGCDVTPSVWRKAVTAKSKENYIVQSFVSAPKKPMMGTGEHIEAEEFFGVDIFLLNGKYSGAVSRCHTNRVFNVGNNGKESVTLVVSGVRNKVESHKRVING